MKGKQRGEQHDLHSVFLDKNKKTKKTPRNKTPESRDPCERVSNQRMCGWQENEQNTSLVNRSLCTFPPEIK